MDGETDAGMEERKDAGPDADISAEVVADGVGARAEEVPGAERKSPSQKGH